MRGSFAIVQRERRIQMVGVWIAQKRLSIDSAERSPGGATATTGAVPWPETTPNGSRANRGGSLRPLRCGWRGTAAHEARRPGETVGGVADLEGDDGEPALAGGTPRPEIAGERQSRGASFRVARGSFVAPTGAEMEENCETCRLTPFMPLLWAYLTFSGIN